MNGLAIIEKNDQFFIAKNEHPLLTPGGNPVRTGYKELAERILGDIEKYGMAYTTGSSILSWHFTMLDNFLPLGRDKALQIMSRSFMTSPDWTCSESESAHWKKVFGTWAFRQRDVGFWIRKLTLMQLVAACCIGNAFESLNLAFVLAFVMEKYDGEDRKEKLKEVAEMIECTLQFGMAEEIMEVFENFEFYYGFHLKEKGPCLESLKLDLL